jgi:DNA invertase Pin-like site-specific DNA recombinase
MAARYLSYRRVSTEEQRESKLGLEAQAVRIRQFVEDEGGEIVGDYVDVMSGKYDDRPELEKARAYARKHKGCWIVVSKLDRLRRDVHYISGLMKDGVRFVVAELGHDVDPFMLHIYAAVAEKERKLVGQRTKDALAALKPQGVKLGAHANPDAIAKGRETQRRKADKDAATLISTIREIQAAGARTLAEVAATLNERRVPTTRGGRWHATTVHRVIARMAPAQ